LKLRQLRITIKLLQTDCQKNFYYPKTVEQEINTLIDGEQQAGYHQIIWDGKDNSGKKVGTGIYIYQLKTENFIAVMKMILIE
jgi:flagellar hook assembly protein FlgD